ncbi:Extracellular ligand-binding receptor [Neobacillus bataviensis LMG 21833]|uniref:Extracellular ligand-binding receptor n=1 Tax=Neobacillus bataviensis LMG 21833 TaxID=1117379 RepID=K6DC62_9BACI|nr:ABC transporter substrate-binding protein [Neobacillus bataviensis]EKN65894.1 Extracellular ligand-binding receptor [Neobacillus bataviensis LMG 21833]
MKKFLTLHFLLAFLLVISGCSSNSSSNSASSGSASKNDKGNYVQGVTKDEILIGHIGPQSGPAATFDNMRKGIETYFKYVNENGGVDGRKLKLIAYDDQYQPAKAVQLAKRLVEEDKVFTMLGPVGTASNLAALNYYKQKGIPITMIASGAKPFVEPLIPNVLGQHPVNYGIEGKVFLNYAVEKLGAKKIAIAYQNDDLGKEGYEAVKNSIKEYKGVEVVAEVNFQTSDVELSSQAKKLQESNPDVIMDFSTPSPAANLKKAMYKIGLKDIPYMVTYVGGGDTNLFNLAGKEVWNGTISSNILVDPEQSADDKSAKLYEERFSKDWPDAPVIGYGQLGWAEAEVLVEALKRTGKDLTWKKYLDSFYTFDKWKGSMFVDVSFSKENHHGLTSLFMTKAEDGKIQPISDVISFDPVTGKITY